MYTSPLGGGTTARVTIGLEGTVARFGRSGKGTWRARVRLEGRRRRLLGRCNSPRIAWKAGRG
jgi:hypothetical protein